MWQVSLWITTALASTIAFPQSELVRQQKLLKPFKMGITMTSVEKLAQVTSETRIHWEGAAYVKEYQCRAFPGQVLEIRILVDNKNQPRLVGSMLRAQYPNDNFVPISDRIRTLDELQARARTMKGLEKLLDPWEKSIPILSALAGGSYTLLSPRFPSLLVRCRFVIDLETHEIFVKEITTEPYRSDNRNMSVLNGMYETWMESRKSKLRCLVPSVNNSVVSGGNWEN